MVLKNGDSGAFVQTTQNMLCRKRYALVGILSPWITSVRLLVSSGPASMCVHAFVEQYGAGGTPFVA